KQEVLEISYVDAKLGKSLCRKVLSCRSFHWVHALLVWVFKGCDGQLSLISFYLHQSWMEKHFCIHLYPEWPGVSSWLEKLFVRAIQELWQW
ncbi:hypothetical protein S83_066806, partial [Arachis hypogaea]